MLSQLLPLLVSLLAPIGTPSRQDPAPQDERATARAALEAIGASVQPLAQDSDALVVNFTIHAPQATDADLVHLEKLGRVVELALGRTKITDAGLAHVA